ncbi:MAG: transcription elongation factor GreB [Myxococcota bacterium]
MPSYISPAGHKRIVDEYNWLLHKERPRITAEVAYAASLGDRSENSEYLYGKKRLREIDKRLHFLLKRLESMEVVDPTKFTGDTVRFGATVEFEDENGEAQTWTILGEDEVDTEKRVISYVAPLGRALMGKSVGDSVTFETPKGKREVVILSVAFPR